MAIRQQGGVFGRNPSFNDVNIDGTLAVDQIIEKTASSGVSLDGVTLQNGNVVLANGKGIDFSATSGAGTSELFDHYKVGTWTPVLFDASTGGNQSSTNGGGEYTKIGRQVTVRFNLDNISTTGLTSGNTAFIGNLPFTPSGNSMGSFYTYRVGGGAAQSASLVASSGLIRLRIFLFSGNSANTDVTITVGDIVSGISSIHGTISYFV